MDNNGNVIKDYIYMDGEYVAHIETTDYDGTVEEIFYPITDHLGQPLITIMAHDEQLVQDAYPTPFGKVHATYKAGNLTLTDQNRRFPGQYYDKETGYHQNWYRDYDPKVGCYLQSDRLDVLGRAVDPQLQLTRSLGYVSWTEGDNHLYSYANQNPIMYYDMYGLVPGWIDPLSEGLMCFGGGIVVIGVGHGNVPLMSAGLGVTAVGGGLKLWYISSLDDPVNKARDTVDKANEAARKRQEDYDELQRQWEMQQCDEGCP